jgi:CheY-like chemotaxis protein
VKLRLLIADGDAERLDLSRRFFEMCGHAVETATGGVECLAKLRQFAPSVLLLEWDLPWGGADGVLACLREYSDLPQPSVVLSADRNDAVSESAAPVAKVHLRPARLGELLRSLQLAAAGDGGSVAV